MSTLRQEDLKKYVGYIKNMEGFLYEQNRAMRSLKQQLVNVNDARYYTPYVKKEKVTEDNYKKNGIGINFSIMVCCPAAGMVLGPIVWAIIRFIIYIFSGNLLSQAFAYFWDGVFWSALKQGFFGGIVIGAIFGIIFFVSGMISDVNTSNDLKKHKKHVNGVNQQVEEKNRQIAMSNKKKKNRLLNRNNLINGEIKTIYANALTTKKILDKAYGLDVIHPKYRYNLSYICAIFEYLDTGRCYTLEGHEGAYNLLEKDIKYNIINDKLDVIITKLDQIQENQSELYNVMMEINHNIDGLHKSIEASSQNIVNNMSGIKERIDAIEYNQEIIVRNTEFQKWYLFFSEGA